MLVGYALSIGSWSADSSDDPKTEVLGIETMAALGSADTRCRVTLYAAASNGRQLTFEAGDDVSVELTAGDITETVMTGVVEGSRSSLRTLVVTGRGGLGKLAVTRVNSIYAGQTAQQIVSDLASQADVDTGDVETGDTYDYVVAHESTNALDLVRRIARAEGMDVYADPDGKLTMKKFTRTTADHTFKYAVHVLDARLRREAPRVDRVLVAGESPASSSGSDSWHQLVKDPDVFLGDAGDGTSCLALQEGLLRTKAGAKRLADAALGTIGAYATCGRFAVLGYPKVRLGDAVAIEDAPSSALNGTFKVVAVRHRFARPTGYVTLIDVVGMDSGPLGTAGSFADAAGGLL